MGAKTLTILLQIADGPQHKLYWKQAGKPESTKMSVTGIKHYFSICLALALISGRLGLVSKCRLNNILQKKHFLHLTNTEHCIRQHLAMKWISHDKPAQILTWIYRPADALWQRCSVARSRRDRNMTTLLPHHVAIASTWLIILLVSPG